jgi:hypothetical protein
MYQHNLAEVLRTDKKNNCGLAISGQRNVFEVDDSYPQGNLICFFLNKLNISDSPHKVERQKVE